MTRQADVNAIPELGRSAFCARQDVMAVTLLTRALVAEGVLAAPTRAGAQLAAESRGVGAVALGRRHACGFLRVVRRHFAFGIDVNSLGRARKAVEGLRGDLDAPSGRFYSGARQFVQRWKTTVWDEGA